jgi:periplasmic divalent cation tolerance protein
MYVAIYTTFQDIEEAKKFGRILIDERLAACVNVVPNVISLYRWDEAVQEDKEVIVWIKTRKTLIQEIHSKLITTHSYDVPAFIVYNIHSGSDEYLQWINSETKEDLQIN